ncbi:hypothetical protein F4802DRAFT_600318 [Xylaria palmicola]|nr:hypothetical protein F4802DRAFT_600318 [Xylaria palmicola]
MAVPQNKLNHVSGGHEAVQHSNSISDQVLMALDIAREEPDATNDENIRNILESALSDIWERVLANESTYIMSRDEFAIFNFFQYRFRDNTVAKEARRRFWDNLSVS